MTSEHSGGSDDRTGTAPGSEVLEASNVPTVMRLVVRNGCTRLLTWECELSDRQQASALPAGLAALGYADVSRFEKVRELTDTTGHSVIIVPATGRVQIRVAYLTPFEAREAAARTIGSHLARAVA